MIPINVDPQTAHLPEPPLRIAIVGTPSQPDVQWTPTVMKDLARLGFTGVQVNIAWSYRPNDEPLNLEDVWSDDARSDERRAIVAERARLARAAGLRTVLHFGAPFQGRAGFDAAELPNCISDPAVLLAYSAKVAAFGATMSDLDDLLVYTYDQDAWLCSEFGQCPRCAGVPLHERVPQFIRAIADAWASTHPEGRTWWEPWELSAGQILASVPSLAVSRVGLMVHSNIGEVISTLPADAFLRTLAATCEPWAIPVVAEVFLSSSNEEVEPWTSLPVPLVTVDQLRAVERVRGVSGVKEYFGSRPGAVDANLAAAAAYFADPSADDAGILLSASVETGLDATWVRAFWTESSRAYQLLPWESSWFARQLGRSQVDHELSAAIVRGSQSGATEWDTPAWRSSRHATFMRTGAAEAHPWLLEDVGLRFGLAADRMQGAVDIVTANIADLSEDHQRVVRAQLSECIGFVTRCRAYALHVRETAIALTLRGTAAPVQRREQLWSELEAVLRLDLANQQAEFHRQAEFGHTRGFTSPLQEVERWVVAERTTTNRIEEALGLLQADREKFLAKYLDVEPLAAHAGQFSLTSR